MSKSKRQRSQLSAKLIDWWHPTLNGDLRPEDISAWGRKITVWFLHYDEKWKQWHEWDATPSAMSRGEKCPICTGHRLVVGINDLATRNPALAAMWHPTMNGSLTPKDVTEGNEKTVWFRHYEKKWRQWHEWDATVKDMGRRGKCSICTGGRLVVGINDLATRNTTVAKMWHPTLNGVLTAQMVTEHSGETRWWQHYHEKTGIWHEWPMRVADLTRKKPQSCSVCDGVRVQVGANDLAITHSVLASEWHPTKNGTLTPQMVTKGSKEEVWWQKECLGVLHEWHATPGDRTRKGHNGCAICTGKQVQIGVNDLASQYPNLKKEWDKVKNKNLKPEMVTKSCNQKVFWKHYYKVTKAWHSWPTRISDRTRLRRPSGCSECSKGGFDSKKPAQVYVLSDIINNTKVIHFGISANIQARLVKHAHSGFANIPVRLLSFSKGVDARDLELSLLELMKEHDIPSCSKQGIKFDGSTEAFCLEDADEEFLIEFRELVGL